MNRRALFRLLFVAPLAAMLRPAVPSGYKIALARFVATKPVRFAPGAIVINGPRVMLDGSRMDPNELYRMFSRRLEQAALERRAPGP